MTGVRYANRSPASAVEAALVLCADFAAECKRQGDMSNFYRWKNVINEVSRLSRLYPLNVQGVARVFASKGRFRPLEDLPVQGELLL